MELFVVMPAPSAAASPRTVALALEAPPECVTVAALKAEIERQSARVYRTRVEGEGCNHDDGLGRHHHHHHHEHKEEGGEEEEDEEDEDVAIGGIPAALQRLTLGGRHLPEDCTLAECAVTE
jgi:hypothetical protein